MNTADRDIPEEIRPLLPGEPPETKPFRANPRNDFLTVEDVTAVLRFATVERNRGDHAAADQILAQLHRSAVKTWGVGHRQLAPITAEIARWKGHVTSAPAEDIPEEMVEKAARALAEALGIGDRYDVLMPDTRARLHEQACAVLSAALAGRTVVDLPHPDSQVDILPTKYDVSILPRGDINRSAWSVTVAYRGNDLYAVLIRDHWCLSKDGTSEIEPIPSERDDEWIADHRFPLAEALRLAVEHAPTLVCNGKTATEILQWINDRGVGDTQ
jgi:hypothetical protein